MRRITEKNLQAVVDRLNRETESPTEYSTGGGYVSKRQLWELIHAYLRGIQAGRTP